MVEEFHCELDRVARINVAKDVSAKPTDKTQNETFLHVGTLRLFRLSVLFLSCHNAVLLLCSRVTRQNHVFRTKGDLLGTNILI